MAQSLASVPHSRVNALKFIQNFLQENDIKSKLVVDVSAGSGYVANLWHNAGAKVDAYDLYPELLQSKALKCSKIDLNEKLPIQSNYADFVLLMETIDHIPNQYLLLQELSRILKPNGKLIITKPNNSNIIGRLANLWLESERSDMFLPNEKSVIGYDTERVYLGRIFLCGFQKLRTLAGIAGLKIEKIYPNQKSVSSILWFILVGWFFYLRTFITYRKLYAKSSAGEKEVLKEQFRTNKNFNVLFQKHLCVCFVKE
jgi:SAM-dependent methyltransferase